MAIWQTEGKRVKKKNPENHMRQVEGAGGGVGEPPENHTL